MGKEVGIDVEAVHLLADADAIASRFFSCLENIAYFALEPHHRTLGFFRCWTRNEALITAHGEGLTCRLDAFDVSIAPGEPAQIPQVGSIPGHLCGWALESFSPAPGFVATVVAQTAPRVEIKSLTMR